MKILILEDDNTIASGLEYSLKIEGYETVCAKNVSQALAAIEEDTFDLYILDVNLPDGSGYDVCRAVRGRGNTPVIFLTAFDDEVNVVMGLEMGADDYVSKPFRLRELLARVKVVLKRSSAAEGSLIELETLTINFAEGKVYKNGDPVFMTALEYRVLLILLNNRGKVMTRNQILESIWDVSGDFVNDNTLTVYIKRIREKIEDEPNNPKIIKTVRGFGYRID